MVASKGKIRVLNAIRQGLIGGGESHVLSLVENVDRMLYDPSVLSFTDGPMISRLNEMGVQTHVIQSKRAFDVFKWYKIRSLLQRESIDIVHVHGTRAASNLLWASKSCGIPVIYTIHGWSFHDDQTGVTRWLRTKSEQILTRNASLNISVSSSNRQTGVKHFPRFSSVIVNNGIDLDKFNPFTEYSDVRGELGIPRDKLLVTFAARMTLQKAPLIMLSAFKELTREYDNVVLLMVGEGDLRDEAERLAVELELQNRVIFQNFRSDMAAILSQSDIFCLPSFWEGMPIGLLEAMAMKNAVIATMVDGSKEIIENNENGLLIPANSAQKMAEGLLELCKDSDKRKRLQENAYLTVARGYNVQTMAAEISSIYSKVYSKSIKSEIG